MDQNNNPEGVIDLSDTLEESQSYRIYEGQEFQEENNKRIPALYRFIIKISHGLIKNENQAQAVAILFIIVANFITFSLLLKGNSGNVSEQTIPADSENIAGSAK